jgi:hypothetical protein
MITNFFSPEERKNIIKLQIPKPLPYFEPTMFFCFCLCLCSFIAVLREEEYIASLVLGLLLAANILMQATRIHLSRRIRNHYNNIKLVHSTFETPVMTTNGNTVEFTFISPSEAIMKQIEETHKLLLKELG